MNASTEESITERLTGQYFVRPQPHDAQYHYELHVLIDLMRRAEDGMRHEGIDARTAERVLRAMLIGAPDPESAEQRINEHRATATLMAMVPTLDLEQARAALGVKVDEGYVTVRRTQREA